MELIVRIAWKMTPQGKQKESPAGSGKELSLGSWKLSQATVLNKSSHDWRE